MYVQVSRKLIRSVKDRILATILKFRASIVHVSIYWKGKDLTEAVDVLYSARALKRNITRQRGPSERNEGDRESRILEQGQDGC